MKVEYANYSIRIIPETDMDKVYLEAILNLKNKGDRAIAERIAPMGLKHAWAYLEIKKNVS